MENWLGIITLGSGIFGTAFAVTQWFSAEYGRRKRSPAGDLLIFPKHSEDGTTLRIRAQWIGDGITWNVLLVPVSGLVVEKPAELHYMREGSDELEGTFAVTSVFQKAVLAHHPVELSSTGKLEIITFKDGKFRIQRRWVGNWLTRHRHRTLFKQVESRFDEMGS